MIRGSPCLPDDTFGAPPSPDLSKALAATGSISDSDFLTTSRLRGKIWRTQRGDQLRSDLLRKFGQVLLSALDVDHERSSLLDATGQSRVPWLIGRVQSTATCTRPLPRSRRGAMPHPPARYVAGSPLVPVGCSQSVPRPVTSPDRHTTPQRPSAPTAARVTGGRTPGEDGEHVDDPYPASGVRQRGCPRRCDRCCDGWRRPAPARPRRSLHEAGTGQPDPDRGPRSEHQRAAL